MTNLTLSNIKKVADGSEDFPARFCERYSQNNGESSRGFASEMKIEKTLRKILEAA